MRNASIRCITFTDGEESAFETEGQLEFSDAYTRVSYQANSYAFIVTAYDTWAEIVRMGADAYCVHLQEGETRPIKSGLLQAEVFTHALKQKRTENGYSFMASYSLGGGTPMKLFITATLL